MSDKRFEYDEDLLLSCARSPLAASVASEEDPPPPNTTPSSAAGADDGNSSLLVDGDDAACSLLHEQHARHYNRHPPTPYVILTKEETLPNGNHQYMVNERLKRFLQSVLHVQNHNSQTQSQSQTTSNSPASSSSSSATGKMKASRKVLHRVTLNQFADEDITARLLLQHYESDTRENHLEMEGTSWNTLLHYDSLDAEWILEYPPEKTINITANLAIGHGGTEHLNHRTKKAYKRTIQNAISDKITFPNRESDPNFAIPPVDDPKFDGALLRVQPRRKVEKDLERHRRDNDPYGKYLNWATHDNPDNVPIVHDPIDQVRFINSVYCVL